MQPLGTPRSDRDTFIDVQVTCGLSTNSDRLRRHAHNDGSAAKEAAKGDGDRLKVPGATLIPFILETGGHARKRQWPWFRTGVPGRRTLP